MRTPLLMRHRTLRQQDAIVGWLLVIPALVLILGITLQPILSTFYLSFFEASSGINSPRTFIGLSNYLSLMKDGIFWATVSRTLRCGP